MLQNASIKYGEGQRDPPHTWLGLNRRYLIVACVPEYGDEIRTSKKLASSSA
jgi:hypothetical protein